MRPVPLSPVDWLARRAHSFMIRSLSVAACLYGALLNGADCHAGAFAVSPTRIDLSDAQSRALIQIDNPTAEPVTLQLKLMAWSQPHGRDQLSPSREILATPQILTVKPGATQILRIGALRKADLHVELAYRLMLEEIPAPVPPDFKGLRVLLKVSLPVFLKPATDGKEQLEVALAADESQQLTLRISNSGNVAAHLRDISLHPADAPATLLASHPTSVYVLAGQQRIVVLKSGDIVPGTRYLIKAASPSGPLQFHATLVPR